MKKEVTLKSTKGFIQVTAQEKLVKKKVYGTEYISLTREQFTGLLEDHATLRKLAKKFGVKIIMPSGDRSIDKIKFETPAFLKRDLPKKEVPKKKRKRL